MNSVAGDRCRRVVAGVRLQRDVAKNASNTIFHALQRTKIHAFIHKKASDSGDFVPRPSTGAMLLDTTGGLPSPDPLTSRPLT